MEGNYNTAAALTTVQYIIPLREMEGNYNDDMRYEYDEFIIPLREMEGNYNALLLSALGE